MHNRYDRIFPATLALSAGLVLLGLVLDQPANILPGLQKIVLMQDLLITDYVYIAGPGAVGVWTKADSVTLFDDFSYQARP